MVAARYCQLPRPRGRRPARIGNHCPFRAVLTAILVLVLLSWPSASLPASDHADPIDILRRHPLEPVITDLFVFPVDRDGRPVMPLDRTDKISLASPDLSPRPELNAEQRARIQSLIVILCVRRALTESSSLNLEPYTYRVYMDTRSTIAFTDGRPSGTTGPEAGSGYQPAMGSRRGLSVQEAVARYGGLVMRPENIREDVTIEIRLKNDATLMDLPMVQGLADTGPILVGPRDPDRISVWTGIRDDPFIFPAFFGTNVVAMVISIPINAFRPDQRDWIVWGTSREGDRQIDHVGRSLRTQNPRFELLNTIAPREHVAAITREHESPGLMRDIFLRVNLQSLYAYREWDFVPDVMIYSNRYPVGFPNGRLLTDDVAALLAQHGDTLLLELSHHNAQWPRRTMNDKPFLDQFPYLAEPWPDRPPPPQPQLSLRSRLILLGIGLFVLLILALALLEVRHIVRWLRGRPPRRQYL